MPNIRNETPADYRAVEDLTRRAFYNLYVPGCHEHYLVHVMRDHPDFLPELDGSCPAAMLVRELKPHALDGGPWAYRDSPVMHFDQEAARRFDEGLPPMARRVLPCQEEFHILSNSVLR